MVQITTIDVNFSKDGLVPTAAQDVDSGEVLMLAYVLPEVLDRTIEVGQVRCCSRGRDELWEKGASNGHTQEVREVRVDCSAGILLHLVDRNVDACRTGRRSCFYRIVEDEYVGEHVSDPDAVYDNG